MTEAAPFTDPGEEELARQLDSLALARVVPEAEGGAMAAAVWWNGLASLGISVPLFVVHDFGFLLSHARERQRFRQRPRPAPDAVTPRLFKYERLLDAVASAEAVDGLGHTFLRDELVSVLLARLLADAAHRWRAVGGMRAGLRRDVLAALPLSSTALGKKHAPVPDARGPEWALSFLPHLLERKEALLLRMEEIDLGPIRLLGMFPAGAMRTDLLDLHQLLETRGTGGVVDFCLQLLPSLLETKKQGVPQRFAVDGYASLERRGGLDAIFPSELAHDPETFDWKWLSNELLFYGHERPQDGARRVHWVLVDASASMRGAREVFARGLALALVKKLFLSGAETWLRFFDGRLHRQVPGGTLSGHDLPYVLFFRSERGRHYGRVFSDLLTEVEREIARTRRELALTFITHAECHIPTEIVEALSRRARLGAIFVLPSRPLAVDYLSLLHHHEVVTPETIAEPAARKRRALAILRDVIASGATRWPAA